MWARWVQGFSDITNTLSGQLREENWKNIYIYFGTSNHVRDVEMLLLSTQAWPACPEHLDGKGRQEIGVMSTLFIPPFLKDLERM